MNQILTSLIKTKSESSNLSIKDLNYVNLAGQTEGYLPADLRDLVDRAIHQAAIRSIASNQSPSVRFSPPSLLSALSLSDSY